MLLIVLSLFFSNTFFPVPTEKEHAIYISVVEIDASAKSIKVKIFANDLSDAIFNHSQQRIDLLARPCTNNRSSIESYFEDHLQIAVDGKPLNFSLQSCEINDASIWLNFTFTSSDTWRKMEVNGDYLMELFPTQSNVVSVYYKGEKKMFRLIKGDSKYQLELKN